MRSIFRITPVGAVMIAAAGAALALSPARSDEAVRIVAPPVLDTPLAKAPATATAVLAGGCFWGLEGMFEHVAGVRSVRSGYAGGAAAAARYEIVGSGLTHHAEAVEIRYDPSRISYGRLLQLYFSVAHDPTLLDRQGPDRGSQYRSTIFAGDATQAKVAANYIAQLDRAKAYGKPLATTVEVGRSFYPAEAYHQNFLKLNPDHGYIVVNDLPKVAALKRLFPALYLASPVG